MMNGYTIMNGHMSSGMMGIVSVSYLLLIILMVLGIAALIKYLRNK